MKRDFLIAYDYRMGGIWGLIHARSKEEIEKKYPKLIVVEQRPKFIDDADLRWMRENRYCDIDDAPSGWFLEFAAS